MPRHFIDLPRNIIVSGPIQEVRRGRKPLNGARAMTGAERAKRYRELRNATRPKRSLPPIPRELLPGPLTAQISKDSFVRRLIDARFPKLATIARDCNKRLRGLGLVKLPKVHDEKVVAMLVGTAIDLRIRIYFQCDIHRSRTVELGLSFYQIASRKRKCLNDLIPAFESFVARVKPQRRRLNRRTEELLCRFCVLFAYLDFIGRAPLGNSAMDILTNIASRNLDNTLSRLDENIVLDVIELSKLFWLKHESLIANTRHAIIGGALAGSSDIGGADFDLIADGCLIEFKASRHPKVTTQIMRQLAGYWLLDYDDALKIRSFGICLLRHGRTIFFEIERDLFPAGPFTELRSTFRTQLARIKSKSKH